MDIGLVTDSYVESVMYRRFGLAVKKTGNEWHSGCPRCGGHKRFVIFANGGMYCRECPQRGWLDDDQKNFKPDPLLLIQRAEEIKRRRAEQDARDTEWQAGYRAGYAQGWHDALTEINRAWWRARGIEDTIIEKYQLGYCPNKHVQTDAGEIEMGAYTIPIRNPVDWKIVNVQYRLENPPTGVGKYRQERGISAAAFFAERADCGATNALVVEGAIKAMVCYDGIEGATQVIGLPGCAPSEKIIEQMKVFRRLWIALDPGAESAAQRLKDELPQARVLDLPDKPDDLFLHGGLTRAKFHDYARQAR